MRRVVIFLFAAIVLFFPNAKCFSQESASAGQLEWNPSSAGPITTWTAPLLDKGKFAVQPFLFYTNTRGEFDSDGKCNSFSDGQKEYSAQQQLFVQYGLSDKWEIDGQMGYQENYEKEDGLNVHAAGYNDSYLFGRYCFFEEKGLVPCLTGLLQVKIPTGKYQHGKEDKLDSDLMGTGSWDPGLGLIVTKKFKPFMIHADAVFSFPQQATVDGAKTLYGKYQNYDMAVEYFLPKGFNLMLESNWVIHANTRQDSQQVSGSNSRSITIAPGIGWSNEKIQTLLAYQRVVSGINADANDSVVLTCVYNF